MTKGKKLALTIAATVLVIGGILGGTAVTFAQDETETEEASFMDRVTAIYEDNTGTAIDADQLEEAIRQAQQEFRSEARENMFDKLVEDGVITKEEADEFQAWLDAKPDIDIEDLDIDSDLPFGRNHHEFSGRLKNLPDLDLRCFDEADT